MEQNYANMCPDRFVTDLTAKKWAIVVRCPTSHQIVGFSTQVMMDAQVAGRNVHALYSGDTVVDRDHWGDPALAHAWGNLALVLADRYPLGHLYWFLTSKGFRTYRYLPLFFRSYFPRVDSPTPSWELSLIDAFGQRVGGRLYDPSRNIIRATAGKDCVLPDIGEPGKRRCTDPHVRFFVERNPNFTSGDELCCLAPLSRANFSPVAYRVIGVRPEPPEAV
jgi:hypothetical protein